MMAQSGHWFEDPGGRLGVQVNILKRGTDLAESATGGACTSHGVGDEKASRRMPREARGCGKRRLLMAEEDYADCGRTRSIDGWVRRRKENRRDGVAISWWCGRLAVVGVE